MTQQGSLSCVGLGMMLGAHLAPRSRSYIELWVQEMRPDARSLQPYYQEGKVRLDSYREMVEAMLVEVRAGRRVCGVFYGHPGVFALVPHKAIAGARAEGFDALMEPGISAEDCLYADLGIDPGTYGCAQFEASQFMFYQRRIDPSAYLVLWQVGMAGDLSLARFATGPAYRQVLVDVLAQDYPMSHPVIAYEAATLPITAPRMDEMPLSELVDADLRLQTTLVVPPDRPMQRNQAMLARLEVLDGG
jgi:hypothetical protein